MAYFSCSRDERDLTLDDILSMLEDGDILAESNQQVDVYIQPPNNANNDLTDEDSGDEDGPTINNLPRSLLLAPAQISSYIQELEQQSNSNSCTSSDDETIHATVSQNEAVSSTVLSVNRSSTSSNEVPARDECHLAKKRKQSRSSDDSKQTRTPPNSDKRQNAKLNPSIGKTNYRKLLPHKKTRPTYEWKQEDLEPDVTFWPIKEEVQHEKTPMEQFFDFFDEDIIDLMVDKTNRYAALRNRLGDISTDEMKCFIAILLMSGYIRIPRRRMFWESASDSHNEFVAKSLSRDRFEFIMSNIHVCDNDLLDQSDKYAKVRPLYDALNNKFFEFSPHEEHHSIDEAMVPYFGRHSLKQFIKNKPIRYGYKIWVGTTSKGYIIWKDPYQGKSQTLNPKYADLGLGASVVLNYSDVLKRMGDFPFFLYFDNFFCGLPLMKELKDKNIRAIGTIREDRTSKCPIEDSKSMKKKDRGALSYRSEKSLNVVVARWNDNSIVTVISNAVGIEPLQQVKRYSVKEKKHVNIPQPNLINQYNKKMGGVDRSDQNMSLYRIQKRGKKWYFSLISDCIDSAEQNAWQLHRHNGGKLDHLAFRRRIVCNILETFDKGSASKAGRPSKSRKIDSRFDRLDHWVVTQEKQTRCGLCHTKCTTRCKKCDIGLHTKCFLSYHTKA